MHEKNARSDIKKEDNVFRLGTDWMRLDSFCMVLQFIFSGIAGQDLAPFPKPIGGVVSGSLSLSLTTSL